MRESDMTGSEMPGSDTKKLWQSAHEKFFLSALEGVALRPELKSQLNSSSAASREALAEFLDSKHGQHQGLFPDRKTEDWKYTGLMDLEGFIPRLARAIQGGGTADDFPSWIGGVAAKLGIQPDTIQSDPLLYTVTFRPGEGARILKGSRPNKSIDIVTLESRVNHSSENKQNGAQNSHASQATMWGAAFEALHTAFTPFCNCITIKRSPDNQIPTVLIIEDLAALPDEQFTAAQWSINLQEGASAQIIRVQTDGRGEEALRVIKTDINLAARAECSLLLVQESTQGSHAICLTQTRVAANALFKSLTLSSSTGLIRNQLDIALSGERAAAQFDGYYHPKEKGHIDNFSTVTHRVGNTTSNQLYKGLLEDSGHGVFRGIVKIDTGADGSAAHQLNRSILLGAGAQVDTKPELRIDADEVSCSHGASVGPLSEDEIFYLQSRALSRSEALAMMCKGFVEELASRDIPAQISTCYLNWLRNEVLPTVQELQ
jgi:Fe-S cluster assembly scaffold protein SufB